MSIQPRSKSAAPARSKSPKPHRKGTSATPLKPGTRSVASVEKPTRSEYSRSENAGKPSTSTSSREAKTFSKASPRKREKTNARSQDRAKRFADTRGTQVRSEEPRTAAPTVRPDTRPTTRRDARIAEIARGDGRPNFEPQKRTKFIPGGKRTGSTTRSAHSGIATPGKSSFNRTSSSRSTNNFASSPSNSSHSSKGGKSYSSSHSQHGSYVEDFGADDNYIVDIEQETTEQALHHKPTEATGTTFADLGIAPELVQLLTSQGINAPFPIQVATLPDAIKGLDILGRGQTGSGKTLAFGLALLTRLQGKQAAPHRPLALVLTPTRELALQINDVLTPLAKALRLDSVVIAGGMPYAKQITAMRKACPILVATPGRLIDLLNRGEVQLDDLQITVLDEADQMADMGFLPVVKEILDQARPNGQRLLFSATLDRGVDSLVRQYLNNPKTHSLQNDRASVSTMEHHVLVMHPSDKDEITAQIAARDGRTILFVKTQRGADRLADKLASVGVAVGALHGGKSQAVRTRTLAHFKANSTAALVATDVAARGIHVDGVSLVVHVDAPTDHKDYLHRAGRTARAGEAGVVVTLATSKQQSAVRGLTSRAGVFPKFVDVRPHHAELVSITGSKEPSGIAYVAPVVEKSDFGGARRRPRPGSDQRRRRPR
ncbi:MAG: DEAD/DEAH box helicase [Actinobacteria bacterium]|nr:DEAD/DEAH box helicase [Actinomycetota bacterium]